MARLATFKTVATAFAALVTALAPQAVHASDPYGQKTVTNRNMTLTASLGTDPHWGPLAAGLKVSGTAVNVSFNGQGNTGANYQGSDPWSGVKIKKITGKIADSDDMVWTTFAGLPPSASGTGRARFASTRFPHGSTVTLSVKVEFDLFLPDGDEIPDGTETVETTADLSAYNAELSWGNEDDRPPINGLTNLPTLKDMSEFEVLAFRAAIVSNLNHLNLVPAPHSDQFQIGAALKHATSVYASTHGTSQGLNDSKTISQGQVGYMPWATIESAVTSQRILPSPNWVFLYACGTLGGGPDVLDAFNLPEAVTNDPITWSRFLIGFDQDVVSFLKPNSSGGEDGLLPLTILDLFEDLTADPAVPKGSLRMHFNRVLQGMGVSPTGSATLPVVTAQAALDAANRHFPPRRVAGAQLLYLPAGLAGDPRSTMKRVYRRPIDPPSAASPSWYLTLP